MSVNGLIFVLIAAVLTMAANLLMRLGIQRAGGFGGEGPVQVMASLGRLALQLPFDTGVVLYVLASIVWFRVIATEPLSIAYPVLVSLTFVAVTIGALIFFNESLDTRKLAGMLLIIVGIYLVSRGSA